MWLLYSTLFLYNKKNILFNIWKKNILNAEDNSLQSIYKYLLIKYLK